MFVLHVLAFVVAIPLAVGCIGASLVVRDALAVDDLHTRSRAFNRLANWIIAVGVFLALAGASYLIPITLAFSIVVVGTTIGVLWPRRALKRASLHVAAETEHGNAESSESGSAPKP